MPGPNPKPPNPPSLEALNLREKREGEATLFAARLQVFVEKRTVKPNTVDLSRHCFRVKGGIAQIRVSLPLAWENTKRESAENWRSRSSKYQRLKMARCLNHELINLTLANRPLGFKNPAALAAVAR